MDTIIGTNPSEAETDTSTPRQKSISAKQLAANRMNAKFAGRPKGSGVKLVDWDRYQRLRLHVPREFGGPSQQAIVDALGISVRTFKRRKRDRQREDEAKRTEAD